MKIFSLGSKQLAGCVKVRGDGVSYLDFHATVSPVFPSQHVVGHIYA